ncbi:MAG: Crp/Fnr family transcriptional regulator [Bacteroidetes bacterium]|nr:Crp/Fnr family transcriptional regulator [Bacteroidota bacterium]
MNDKLSSSDTIKITLSKISPITKQTAIALASATEIRTLEKDTLIETSGQQVKYQFVVLKGIIRKFLTNVRGDEFTTDFFLANQAITPALLRSVDFMSFVNLQVISDKATVMFFSNKEMEATMQGNKDLEAFGFKVMMQDAFKRAEREKILLTASGIEKLEWFRKNYPKLENEIPHYYIASFLGLTPTSLSRLRGSKK